MDHQPGRPSDDSWVAAVHGAEDDETALGSAFVLDEHRLLTCAHVVSAAAAAGTRLWIAFPKAEECDGARVPVEEIVLPPAGMRRIQDAAVLRLASPVPAGRIPRLRCPLPGDTVGRDWWAFGFPGGELLGNSAAGVIGESLSYGWVRLDTHSRYSVRSGFSGSAMWSPEYDAVVGMVGQASGDGDARALTLRQIDRIFPGEGIAARAEWTVEAAGESALASWGWSLRNDPEAGRHWRPRARGVSIDTEKGFRFRGRTAALTAVADWIQAPPNRRALVVTGSPGVGKSAVLGRIVTTADREIAALLPPDDTAVRSPVGSISCAVHAKGKDALDVAVEIAAAASAALPDDIEYLPELLREALTGRPPADFTVVIDALDEAGTPQQVRLIIRRIIIPLVETCADLNIRVIVGSRRRDDAGDLLARFGRAISLVDLDLPAFFEQEDLRSYTLATLQLVGDERPDNPYADDTAAEPVARRIAAMADRNFLVAGLVARAHGLHDLKAVRPGEISFIPTVDGALRDYLDRIKPVHGCAAGDVLTALAFAEAPGFPLSLWRMAITALGGPGIPEAVLVAFARSSAANFLVETGGGARQEPMYRLFHQALNDTLISARAELHTRRDDERALARAMIAEGGRTGWADADPYLRRSLPGHAETGDVLDELLADDAYPLHADLRRLLPVTDRAGSERARVSTKFIRRTRQAFNAGPARRTALFSVTEAQQRLGRVYRDLPLPAPYRARWSTVVPGREEAVLEGHTRWSYVLSAFTAGGRDLLASAGGDRTVRIWDPVLGEALHVMEGHTDEIRSIVAVRVGEVDALASAGRDSVIRFWDPLTGEALHTIAALGGDSGYSALCAVTWGDRVLLAAAPVSDRSIRLLDPATGRERLRLDGHTEWITGLCEITDGATSSLASCGEDYTVRLWDLTTGEGRKARLDAVPWDEDGWIQALCTVRVDGRLLLAGAGYDGVIRLWNPGDGSMARVVKGHEGSVYTMCATAIAGDPVLVSAGEDSALWLWDPRTGRPIAQWHGHTDAVYSVCAIRSGTRLRLASSGDDRSIRLWDPATGGQETLTEEAGDQRFDVACALRAGAGVWMATARIGEQDVALRDPVTWETVRELATAEVNALCTVPLDGRSRLAVAGRGIEIWDPETATRVRALKHPPARYTSITSLCAVEVDGAPLLVGSLGSSLHFWRLDREHPVHAFDVGHMGAREICLLPVHGRLALAGLTFDGRIRVWDPESGLNVAEFIGRRVAFTTQCAVRSRGRALLAVGDEHGLVHLWDGVADVPAVSLEGHSGRVRQLWVSVVGGRTVLVSAGADRSLRVWDPDGPRLLMDIPVNHTIEWAAQAGPDITLSLDTGMLGIRLDLSATEG